MVSKSSFPFAFTINPPPPRSMCGRYASYWNAFLLLVFFPRALWWFIRYISYLKNVMPISQSRRQKFISFWLWTIFSEQLLHMMTVKHWTCLHAFILIDNNLGLYVFSLLEQLKHIKREPLYFYIDSINVFFPFLYISGHFMPGAMWHTAGCFTGTDTHRLNTSKHLTTRLTNRRNCSLQLSIIVKMGQPYPKPVFSLSFFKKRPVQCESLFGKTLLKIIVCLFYLLLVARRESQ